MANVINTVDWSTEIKIKAFMISTVALGMLFVAQAQEVDADALVSALTAEIAQVGKGKGTTSTAQNKVDTADDDTFEIVSPTKVTPNASANRLGRTSRNAASEKPEVVVTVMGKGETKEEARCAAFRAAVEKAVGVYVDAESLMKNYEMVEDRVNTISNADIRKYETIKEGRQKSGQYVMAIKAWVEKKAIAPKFADVFPDAFANVSEAAETIHVQKVTQTQRSADAASLMAAALKNVDRMRSWVRLSVPKEQGFRRITRFRSHDFMGYENTTPFNPLTVAEIPGKGVYAVRYSMKIDEDAYFKGFVPHFKQILEKIQEGESVATVLTAGHLPKHRLIQADGGHVVMSTRERDGYYIYELPSDLEPFGGKMKLGMLWMGYTDFVDPVTLDGFPALSMGRRTTRFMFEYDEDRGLNKICPEHTCNIWLLEKMNRDKTVMRCRAYKIPLPALQAYWKSLHGDVYLRGSANAVRAFEQVEVTLLDAAGEEIAVKRDKVPGTLLTAGLKGCWVDGSPWESVNVFDSFFVRPMFAEGALGENSAYSTEILRDVYFSLTDAQLAEVKRVKVRFIGNGK